MIHEDITESGCCSRGRKATVAITDWAATLSISSNKADGTRLVRWELSIVMKVVWVVGGRSLGANIIMRTRAFKVKLLELVEVVDSGKDRSRVRGELID